MPSWRARIQRLERGLAGTFMTLRMPDGSSHVLPAGIVIDLLWEIMIDDPGGLTEENRTALRLFARSLPGPGEGAMARLLRDIAADHL